MRCWSTVQAGVQIALVKASDVRRDEDVNLAGEALDGLVLDKVVPEKLGKAAKASTRPR